MEPLEAELVRYIESNGPIPFAAYMARALYDPRYGYYAAQPRTGWHGHFVTSPEIDPAFGTSWAEGCRQIWVGAGRPDEFAFVEIGPGEGGYARAFLTALDDDLAQVLDYILVERNPRAKARQQALLKEVALHSLPAGRDRVTWVASLDEMDHVPVAVVFANEVLDNLPVHLVEQTGDGLFEIYVDVSEGRFVERLDPPSTPEIAGFLSDNGMELPQGHRIEVPLAARSFIARTGAAMETGAIILIDYGMTVADLLVHPRGTLACYSARGVDDSPLDSPGQKDITTHVNWTAITRTLSIDARVLGPIPQVDVLRALGAADLDDELRADHQRATEEGRGADAIAALSRRQALRVLLDPGGLGGLDVVVGTRGLDEIPFLAALRNDERRGR